MPLPQEAPLMPSWHGEAMRMGSTVYDVGHGGCCQSHYEGGSSMQLHHREHCWRPLPQEALPTPSHHRGICQCHCNGRHCWCHHTMGGAINTITTEWLTPLQRGLLSTKLPQRAMSTLSPQEAPSTPLRHEKHCQCQLVPSMSLPWGAPFINADFNSVGTICKENKNKENFW